MTFAPGHREMISSSLASASSCSPEQENGATDFSGDCEHTQLWEAAGQGIKRPFETPSTGAFRESTLRITSPTTGSKTSRASAIRIHRFVVTQHVIFTQESTAPRQRPLRDNLPAGPSSKLRILTPPSKMNPLLS